MVVALSICSLIIHYQLDKSFDKIEVLLDNKFDRRIEEFLENIDDTFHELYPDKSDNREIQ